MAELVVLGVSHNSKQSFRVVTVYSPAGSGQADFFKKLEKFPVTSKTLVVLGDFNVIIDAPIDCVSSAGRR